MSSLRVSTCCTLFLLFVAVPWCAYTILCFHWPWPSDQGCYQYNCSYGINIDDPTWGFTPYVNNTFIGWRCSAGITTECNSTNGWYNGSYDDNVGILNWMMQYCVPKANGGGILYNNTPCYSGDGGKDIGMTEWGWVACPYRYSCYNFWRDNNRSLFLAIAPVFLGIITLITIGCITGAIDVRWPERSDQNPIEGTYLFAKDYVL